jgi:hypothetical protein
MSVLASTSGGLFCAHCTDWRRRQTGRGTPKRKPYEQEELNTLLEACDDQERLWFEFFLMTGMLEL